jgi:hypothetical protein
MRSDDYGQNWHDGARLPARGLDVDLDDPMHVLVATPDGLRESTDAGMTFGSVQRQPPQPLLLVDHIVYRFGTDRFPAVAGVDASGRVWALGEAGWQVSGTLPGAPTAFSVIGPDRYLAATGQDVLLSEKRAVRGPHLRDVSSCPAPSGSVGSTTSAGPAVTPTNEDGPHAEVGCVRAVGRAGTGAG